MKNIKLEHILKNNDGNFYIIAETAFSHEGNLDYLKELIEVANQSKVDAIKFQILLDYESSYALDIPDYKKIENLCFTPQNWKEIIKLAKSSDLEVILLPIDMRSIEFASENKNLIDALEIHSISINEVPFLKSIAQIEKPLILGVGGRTLEDIQFALKNIEENRINHKNNYIMMYGFQNFPTDYTKINLGKVKKLQDTFQSTIGYADHTKFDEYEIGNELIKYSYLLGARIFEKHIVVKKGEERTDFHSAVSYKELIELREGLNKISQIIGNKNLSLLNDIEIKYRYREKKLVAKRDTEKGIKLKEDHISYKVTSQESDFEQKDFEKLLKRTLCRSIKKDETFKEKYFI